MKIGLVRHFRVDLARRRLMSSKEYNEHVYNYDKAGVIPNEVVIDKEWDKCYCSTLPRAVTTAHTIYHGEISATEALVEIPTAAHFNINIKLPYYVWTIISRVAWIRNHVSQPEGRRATLIRLNQLVDKVLVEKDKNILIVSHAGTMYELQRILRTRGFRGERFLKPRNGKLYVFKDKL